MKNNTKGLSLAEILVVTGLLTVVGSIATVSFNSYIKQGEQHATKKAINDLQTAFMTCMAFSKYDVTKCDTTDKVAYKVGAKHIALIRPATNPGGDNTCVLIKPTGQAWKKPDRKGVRACFQYNHSKKSIVRKCFEKDLLSATDRTAMSGCHAGFGTCCPFCTPERRDCPIFIE